MIINKYSYDLIRVAVLNVMPLIGLVSFLSVITNGPDYGGYVKHYFYSVECFECVLESQGYIFTSIMYLFSFFQVSFEVFYYILVSVFLTTKIYITTKILPKAWVPSLVYYLSSWFILHDLIQIRLSAGITIAYIAAYCYFYLDKKMFGWALIFFSSLIHYSLFLLWISIIILYYLRASKYNQKILIALIILISAYIFDMEIFNDLLIGGVESESSKVLNYAYELNKFTDIGANYFSLHTIDALATAALCLFLLKSINCTDGDKLKFFLTCLSYLAILGFIIKTITIGSPVVSFRLFELFTFGVFILKGWIVSLLAQRSIFLSFIFSFIFILFNIYIFFINGPLLFV